MFLGNGQLEKAAMLEETRMNSIRKHPAAPSFKPFLQCLFGLAFLLAIMAGSGAQAQTGAASIYGVTALDVAPGTTSQGVTLLKQYRDGALKQAGNMGVTLLQEVDWPNRFIIYDAWKDQAAYDANEKAAHSAELRAKLKPIVDRFYRPIIGSPINRENEVMLSIRKPSSGRSCIPFGRWAVVPFLVIAAAIAVVPAARAQTAADAVYAVTYLDVGTTSVAQGAELIKKFREASRREAANLEFTILQETSRPNRFVIMEGWKDQAAFEAHDKGTAKAEFETALKPIRNSPPDRHMLQPFANAPARAIPPGAPHEARSPGRHGLSAGAASARYRHR